MTNFIIVRHGYSVANKQGYMTGQSNVPLAPEGLEQARQTAEFIHKNYKIDAIYSSPLLRAVQTAEPLSELFNLPIITNDGLKEINAGLWEGKTPAEIFALYPEEFSLWRNDVGNSRCTGGESLQEVQTRAVSALKDIEKKACGQTVAIFTHAAVIRSCFCFFKNLPLSEAKNIPWAPNASVSEVIFDNGNFRLITEGQNEHLSAIKTNLPKNIQRVVNKERKKKVKKRAEKPAFFISIFVGNFIDCFVSVFLGKKHQKPAYRSIIDTFAGFLFDCSAYSIRHLAFCLFVFIVTPFDEI